MEVGKNENGINFRMANENGIWNELFWFWIRDKIWGKERLIWINEKRGESKYEWNQRGERQRNERKERKLKIQRATDNKKKSFIISSFTERQKEANLLIWEL